MKNWLKIAAASILGITSVAYAAVSVSVNGTSYSIPQNNEKGWGTAVTSWIQAISANTLQPNSGTFTLSADLDFGGSFGLKSQYYKSRSSNISTAGILRLSNTDGIGWRDSGNTGNYLLLPSATDGLLQYNSINLVNISSAQTLTNKSIDADSNTITNIENADIKSGAAIALNKLAATTASRALVSDGSGVITPATTTATEIGYVNGVTSAIQTQIDSKLPTTITTTGDLIYSSSGTTASRLAIGSTGQVLTVSGGLPTWQNPGASTVPKVTTYTSGSGTWSKTGSPLYIRVRMVGGGGGGGGGNASGGTSSAGGTGGNSTFGTTLLVANGGTGGGGSGTNGAHSTGGSASLGTGPTGIAVTGAGGNGGYIGANLGGGAAGTSPLGGAGYAGEAAVSGGTAATNSGSGGGGGGSGSGTATSGGGGGAGGWVDAVITSPSSSYSYAVGAAGTAGTGGSGGVNGGAGAAGFIEVTEYYQ